MDGICTESLTVVVRIFIFIILTRISGIRINQGRGVICKGDGNKSQINNEILMKHHFSVFEVGKTLKQTEYIWYSAHVHLSAVHVLLSKIYPDKTWIKLTLSEFSPVFFKKLYPKKL